MIHCDQAANGSPPLLSELRIARSVNSTRWGKIADLELNRKWGKKKKKTTAMSDKSGVASPQSKHYLFKRFRLDLRYHDPRIQIHLWRSISA